MGHRFSSLSGHPERSTAISQRKEAQNLKSVRSRTFFDGVVKKGEGVACPRTEGSTKRLYLNPTQHRMLLLPQKDNINRSRSRKSQNDFRFCSSSLYYRSLSQKFDYAQDDTLKEGRCEPLSFSGRRGRRPLPYHFSLSSFLSSLFSLHSSLFTLLPSPPLKPR